MLNKKTSYSNNIFRQLPELKHDYVIHVLLI